jgi:hypothetical protein
LPVQPLAWNAEDIREGYQAAHRMRHRRTAEDLTAAFTPRA